ncbi:electron transfer flavoprotein subunit beta/FixA family protein [Chloroflexota bacterium]
MNIIVCIKQVPAGQTVPVDPVTGALKREGVGGVINPEDLCALEEALVLREKHNGDVTTLSMGPPQAEEALREALAMGVDRAFLLCDKIFAGSDTLVTSFVLSQAVRKLGSFDLILCGKQTSDGNTAQVGPELAERLGLPQVTSVQKMKVFNGKLEAERALESGSQWVEARLPTLATVTRRINTPRQASIESILVACREKEVITWNADDLGIDTSSKSLLTSPTQMAAAWVPAPRTREGEILVGPTRQAVHTLLERLKQRHVI